MKQIKDEFEKYTIKTTSSTILQKYEESKKKKPLNLKWLFPALSFSLVCIFVLAFVFSGKFTDTKIPTTQVVNGKTEGLKDTSLMGELSFDLFIGCEFLNGASTNRKMRRLSSVNGFNKAIDEIHQTMQTINSLYEHKNGFSYKLEKTTFTYNDKTYQYLLTVDDYKLYLANELKDDDNENQKVLVSLQNAYYEGMLEFEKETDEIEMELSYNVGTQKIVVKQETEQDEFSYEYFVYEKGQILETKKLSIETDDELEITYENKKGETLVKLEIKKEESYLLQYEKKTASTDEKYEDVEVRYEENSTVYSYQGEEIRK